MGVKQGPEPDYVTWGDVIQHLRYYEQGYGRKLNVNLFQACPPSEQHPKLYIKLRVCSDDGNDDPMVEAAKGSFPASRFRTLPALLLHMLWELDNRMSAVLLWAEPLAEKPRKGN